MTLSAAGFAAAWWLVLGRHDGDPFAIGTWAALRYGLVDGWGLLLDTAPPASSSLLVIPMALTWAAAAAATLVATRTRLRVAPVFIPAALFAVATGMSFPGRHPAALLGAALAACGALFVLARRSELDGAQTSTGARPLSLRSGAAPGVLIAVAAVALALAVAPQLPALSGRTPWDPRASRPVRPVADVNPLTALTAWRTGPDQVLFEAQAPAPTRWSLAVLDRFDGYEWTSSGRYLRAPAGDSAGDGHPMGYRIEVRGLTGTFLPTAPGLVRVSGPGLAINTSLLTVIAPASIRGPLAYSVYSSPHHSLSRQQLEALQVADDATTQVDLKLPSQIDDLTQLARNITQGTPAPYSKAMLIEQYLRASLGYDPTAPGGHSVGDIDDFITRSHRGSSEQFAVSFAVLARAVGLPTRVVVGFEQGSRVAGTDRYQVHARDAVAWDEVDFTGMGWTSFYPTPDTTKVVDDTSLQGGNASAAAPVQPPSPASHVTGAHPPKPTSSTSSKPRHDAAYALWWLLGAVLFLALAYLAAVLIVPWRRRRERRGARSPQIRVLGAWMDCLETMTMAGFRTPSSATGAEVAAIGGDALRDDLVPLARLAVTALFAAEITSADQADAAWAHRDRLAARLRHGRNLPRRLASTVSPRRLRATQLRGSEMPSPREYVAH
ncbi:transglutaminase domain-containing protein [Frankia sp. AgB1.9]|nr:transglutaminase domain-containing protein [Frankia sp. AgB1.9]MBL7623475.1 transglutaminase domain-containing protein [Frankia sp. AgB1.8]